MSCNNHTGEYFDYKCYYELKDYYDKKFESEIGQVFLREFEIPSTHNHIKKTSFLITKLTNNLASNGFSYHNGAMSCKYINYWLNTQMRSNSLNESDIVFFKTFSDEFFKKKTGPRSYLLNTCSWNFLFLDDGTYERMQTLYEMYRLYKDIITKNVLEKPEHICSNFMSINNHYNTLIRRYPNDDELHKKLEQFKNLVLNEKTKHEGKCENIFPHLMSLPIPFPRRQAITDGGEGISVQQGGSSVNSVQKLELKVSDSITQPALQSQGQDTESTVVEQRSKVSQTSEELLSPQGHAESSLSPNLEDQEQLQLREIPKVIFSPVGYTRKESLVESDGHVYGIDYKVQDRQTVPSSPEGILQSINGAFSRISEYDEPVPLMGVSGGMGALFLLLRYTPVGSYFRGRSGQRHRIPSNFVGYHARFIPGYDEHYNGNFENEGFNISYRPE
ncbi:VIR protein [Plasmodium vivax]|uniref:VIR protein n=1 Tax=Plasmodium vivax TaxID=5855 RepID=A0A1G4E9D2_PLAVI|nr:VIR protein [Plasmodium vivax]